MSFVPNIEKIHCAWPQNLIWNEIQPFVKQELLSTNKTLALINPGLLNVYNLSGQSLGLGIFSPERRQLSFLSSSHETQSLESILLEKIVTAAQKRESLRTKTNAFRLIHHYHDGLPGIVIELYGAIAIIQTSESGSDTLIPLVTEILKKALPLQAIYLMNSHAKRRQYNLIQNEGLLAGSLPSDILKIVENDHQYEFDFSSHQLFPLPLRGIREDFSEYYIDHNDGRILCIGLKPSHVISSRQMKSIQCQYLTTEQKTFSELTENLRSLGNTSQHIDRIIFKTFPVNTLRKTLTSIFHLTHALISLAKDTGCKELLIFGSGTNSIWNHTLKNAKNRDGKPIVLKPENIEFTDFPKTFFSTYRIIL